MSLSWTRVFGLSLIACLLAVVAAPALANDPAHGRTAFAASGGEGTAGSQVRGMRLLNSFQVIGMPVAGPMAALAYAERFIQRFIIPRSAERGTMGNGFPGIGQRAFKRSDLPLQAGYRAPAGTLAIGIAENLTAYLGEKGYDVTLLRTDLSRAQTALSGSNLTAFREAMTGFRSDLMAKVTSGAINSSAIRDYLGTVKPGIRLH